MNKETYNLTLAALLSGIGKIINRSQDEDINDSKDLIEYLKQIKLYNAQKIDDDILDILNSDKEILSIDNKILNIAKKVGLSLEKDIETQKDLPLTSIFTRLNSKEKGNEKRVLGEIDQEEIPFATNDLDQFISQEYYLGILDALKIFLKEVSFDEVYINSVINKFEDLISNVPALPGSDFLQDISLYDYLKITAAIAACLSEYFKTNSQLVDLLDDPDKLFAENTFLLFSADFSGIQSFIYTIATKKALKTLRSRSFFLEFLMEHFIDELLEVTEVTRTNLLYSGGGHCYLLLPNTNKVKEAIDNWTKKFNSWLREEYDIHLYLADGYVPCSINDLLNLPVAKEGEKGSYKQMFEKVSAMISKNKLQRYSADEIRELNSREPEDNARECKICGHSGKLVSNKDGENICESCKMFEDISDKVIDDTAYVVSTDGERKYDFSLPGASTPIFINILREDEIPRRIQNDKQIKRIYSKNKYEQDYYLNTKLNIGDYIFKENNLPIKEMEVYAEKAKGIDRIGICRMDVDDLGSAFISGFEQEGPTTRDREKFISLVRTSAFSRASSNFFKNYINKILDGSFDASEPLKVVIVYSGGDDVFLVGSWDDVIDAAIRIRKAFKEFTGDALTVSAGIGQFGKTYPIRSASHDTEILESAAKEYTRKNSDKKKDAIALFELVKVTDDDLDDELREKIQNRNIFDWDQFELDIQDDKLAKIKLFFSDNTAKGNTLIYNLLSLLRDFETKPINIARFAYNLARIEPPRNSKKELKKQYDDFTSEMYKWAFNEKDELMMALLLYIYEMRKNA